jgi:hypothetical protein
MSVDWREPFEKALDADPARAALRHDYADHLEEAGDPDAEPLRWLAERRLWPMPPRDQTLWTWDWYARDHPFPETIDVGLYAAALVPRVVYDRLHKTTDRAPASYTTRREAERDFCRAYYAARAEGWDPAED